MGIASRCALLIVSLLCIAFGSLYVDLEALGWTDQYDLLYVWMCVGEGYPR